MGILRVRSMGCELHAALQNFMRLFIFPARWLDGLCRALPGAEFSLASLTQAKVAGTAPVDATAAFAKHLTVATTARTTRFCRTHGPPFRRSFPGPVDGAGNLQTRRSLAAPLVRMWPRAHRDYPPCPHLSCRRCRVHRKPGSQSRRQRDRPSRMSRDDRHIRHFRISVKWNIFAQGD